MVGSVVIGVLEVASSLGFVWICKRVVDIATGQLDTPLMESVWLFVGIVTVRILARVAAGFWEGYMVVEAQNGARAEVFAKVIRSTWSGKEKYHSGDTVNRLEEDIRVVVDFLCVNLPSLLTTLIQLVAASVFLFRLAPTLAWLLLFIMPVAVIGSRLCFRVIRRLTIEIRSLDGRVQGHMQETILHRVVVKTLGATSDVLETMDDLQAKVKKKTLTRLNYGVITRGFMQLGFAGGYSLAFLWGVFGLYRGTVTYGLMVAFLQLVGQVQRPVADITRHIPAFIKALSSEERLLELEEMPQEDESSPVVLPGAPGVRISGLSFAYEGSPETVIRGMDFDFKPGTMTAIMGPTGAGKSTLIRLIMALLQPSQGSVEIYGADGSVHVSDASTRCNFMYVPQGNTLMSGTIRQNLLLARKDASDDELRTALHLAAADFVLDLPDGLETSCAEVGAGLSEGQAQRISIARALLRPGGILVLDEATSALDAETEQTLLERLSEHYNGSKTILCITHRPAAIAYADQSLVMSR